MVNTSQYKIGICLSPRERAVLTLMSQGMKRSQVGEHLGISATQAGNYYQQAREKIVPIGEAWTKQEVLKYAQKHKLL